MVVPTLSGTYDVSTLTPMERPEEFGEKMALSNEEAAEIAENQRQRRARRNAPSDPDRGGPQQGGNVGGYNNFYIDNGDAAFQVGGQWRTSILIDPPDGRYPPRVDGSDGVRTRTPNPGTAFWLEDGLDAPGPYDNMEQRPYAGRTWPDGGGRNRQGGRWGDHTTDSSRPLSITRDTTDSYISMIGIISMVPSIIVRCGQVLDIRWMPLMLLPCSTQ